MWRISNKEISTKLLKVIEKYKQAILFVSLFLIGLLSGLYFSKFKIEGDSQYYYNTANLIKQDFLSLINNKNIGITESLNAIFQGILFLLPGNDIWSVYVFQVCLFALTGLIIYKTGLIFLPEKWSLSGVIFFGLNYKIWHMIYSFKPDIWCILFVSWCFYITIVTAKEPSKRRNWIITGVSFGLLLLLDMRYIPYMFLLFCFLLFSIKRVSKVLSKIWIIPALAFLTIAPWLIRQYFVFNKVIIISELKTLMISKVLSTHYYNHVIEKKQLLVGLNEEEAFKTGNEIGLSPSEVIFIRERLLIDSAQNKEWCYKRYEPYIKSGELSVSQIEKMIAREELKPGWIKRLEYGLSMWLPLNLRYHYMSLTVLKEITPPYSLLNNINRILFIGILIPFYLIGFIFACRSKEWTLLLIAAILIVHTAIQAYTYVDKRYLLPVLPLFTMTALYGIYNTSKKLDNSKK
jgi:4-amino-4-deoxy-L-arabinose transferase-like glycosyltransferase